MSEKTIEQATTALKEAEGALESMRDRQRLERQPLEQAVAAARGELRAAEQAEAAAHFEGVGKVGDEFIIPHWRKSQPAYRVRLTRFSRGWNKEWRADLHKVTKTGDLHQGQVNADCKTRAELAKLERVS